MELNLTTLDFDLISEIEALEIEGISAHRQIMTMDCFDPEVMIQANKVGYVLIQAAGTVALSLFSAWLYDRLKSKPAKETKINGVEVSGNNNDVKIQINNYIQIKN